MGKKEYKEKYRDYFTKLCKDYYTNNKFEILDQKKKYYETNKMHIAENNKEKFTCLCGVEITKSARYNHIKSKSHLQKLTENNLRNS